VTRFKLSVMMFLEFFIWGAWFPLVFGYLPSLGFNALEQGLILGAFNLAAFTAMFFSTQFADRTFAAEKFMAFSHLVGGVAILALFWVKGGWWTTLFGQDVNLSFLAFFALLLLHSLFYVPTISISNAIAFESLKDRRRDFGLVRLWGTIGWIAASWPFVFILVDWSLVPKLGDVGFFTWLGDALEHGLQGQALQRMTSYTFVAAGLASLLLALISLGLPHTPPKPAAPGGEQLAWLEAMKLLRVPAILILFIVTFFDSAVHQCYFFWTGRFLEQAVHIPGNWVMPVMSIGQIAEIGTMALLGLALKKMGWRTTMVIGILGHAARFGVFALAPELLGGAAVTFLGLTPLQWVAISVNVLHGICYAFFFATVYIFVDEFFPRDARSSAQGLFNFLILGLGPFVGNFVWGWLGDAVTTPTGIDYYRLFVVPAGVALGAALILLLFFHPPERGQLALPPHALEALERDAAWQAAPADGIIDRDRPRPSGGAKTPDRQLPPEGIMEP
jgi:MFS family permease